jgi:hypothetical protein
MVSDSAYTLPEDKWLVFRDQDGVALQGATTPPTITIGGRLEVDGVSAIGGLGQGYAGIRVGTDGFNTSEIDIRTTGVIHTDMTAGFFNAVGIYSPSFSPKIDNEGVIEAIARRDAYGIVDGGTDQLDLAINNAGTIHVSSAESTAFGIYMSLSDKIWNAGVIDVSGAKNAFGIYFQQFGAGLTNTGTIRAVDANPDDDSIAVYFGSQMFTGRFLNAGLIQGDYALKVVNPQGTQFEGQFSQAAVNTFTNTGTMIGKVDMGPQRQVLSNSGVIQGAVALGSGDDTYSGGGTVSGMVSGGDGADSLSGGAGFDNFQGNAGNDTESGGDGDDWVVGGKDNDLLSGDAGADLVYGNLGADTCDGGAGNDIVRGGQDNDSLTGGAGDDFVSGDKGDDTVMGGAGADIFHTFGDAGIDRVLDFHISEGDRVMLDPGTAYTVAQVGADTVISMTGGGQMVLVGVQMSTLTAGWIFGA